MKKNILLKIALILVAFFAFDNVYAESCSTKELNTLKQLASNIKVSYELQDDTYNESHAYYYTISFLNLNEKFYLQSNGGVIYDYDEMPSRRLENYGEGLTYVFGIYASDKTNCSGTKIVTKKVYLPYYNDYSQKEECNGNEEFELCQPYYGGIIESDDYFYQKLNEYKNKKNNGDKKSEEATILDKIISLYVNNLTVSVFITIAAICIITIVIVRLIKHKNRKIKIKI